MDGKSELLNLIVQTLINITAEMDMKFHKHQKKKLQFPKTAHPKKWNLAKCRCSLLMLYNITFKLSVFDLLDRKLKQVRKGYMQWFSNTI